LKNSMRDGDHGFPAIAIGNPAQYSTPPIYSWF
jgi:hypothetical protein